MILFVFASLLSFCQKCKGIAKVGKKWLLRVKKAFFKTKFSCRSTQNHPVLPITGDILSGCAILCCMFCKK
jgi:hypothetical protein